MGTIRGVFWFEEILCQRVAKLSREELAHMGPEVRDHLDGCWVWREVSDCVGRVGVRCS